MAALNEQNYLVNPTADETRERIEQIVEQANRGARTRTISPDAGDLAEQIAAEPEGVYGADGGAVANSYRGVAMTSHLDLAWWTGPDGVKRVVLAAGRTTARHSSCGAGSGTGACRGTPEEQVRGWRLQKRVSKTTGSRVVSAGPKPDTALPAALLEDEVCAALHLAARFGDPAAAAALADYLAEHAAC